TVLTPHALAWTDEMALGNGGSAIKAILDLQAGRKPTYLANPKVLEHPRLQQQLGIGGEG
ncbi:MAG: dehydrogenase, partial [Nakamurella sp.]